MNCSYLKVFLTVLIFCSTAAHAQFIKGSIVDANTNRPLGKVSVYYDGTSLGAISDDAGNFILRALTNNSTPLIFSSIGYGLLSVTEYSATHPLQISLVPKPIMLRTVNLGYDGKSDKEKEAWFKREFLGNPLDLNGCKILNMDEVLLSYDKRESLLTASADLPVLISSPHLGYTIKYGLEVFVTNNLRTAFQGYQFFEEDRSLTTSERKKVLERRDKAYYGSKMHFIRALWSNTLEKEGFKIYTGHAPVKEDELTVERDGKKFFRLDIRMAVTYKGKTSVLTPKTRGNLIEIDSHGFFDPSGVLWSGEMSKQRIAGLLPFDFQASAKP